MKHILLSALLLAALPTAAMAETDLGSVLMENAISYENADARKAEDRVPQRGTTLRSGQHTICINRYSC